MSDHVGVLFATSGQYEEYRARSCEVYASVDAGKAEADRRNALAVAAREKIEELRDLETSDEDGDWERADKKRKRILSKLCRDTNDSEIESHDINDLKYIVTEARLVR